MTTPTTTTMSKAAATKLTKRIRANLDGTRDLLVEAHDGKAWTALGYKTWADYVKGEFDIGRSQSYRLLHHVEVIKTIGEAVGDLSPMGDISERTARELKEDLPAAAAEIAARAEQGESPAQSAKEIAAERKAAKEKAKAEKAEQQAQYDREREENAERLPEAVKQQKAARDAAIEARKGKPEQGLSDADRIAELEESVRVLEAENATLKTENAFYADMKVQWQAGGYEAVIAGKDEEIRVLETRVYGESAKMASWKRSADFWKDQAIKHGWSNEEVIDLEAVDGH